MVNNHQKIPLNNLFEVTQITIITYLLKKTGSRHATMLRALLCLPVSAVTESYQYQQSLRDTGRLGKGGCTNLSSLVWVNFPDLLRQTHYVFCSILRKHWIVKNLISKQINDQNTQIVFIYFLP